MSDPTLLIIPNTRICFPHLFEKYKAPKAEGEPAYSATFLLDPDNSEHLAIMQEGGAFAKAVEWLVANDPKLRGQKPGKDNLALKDGNKVNETAEGKGKEPTEEFKDMYIIRSANKQDQPIVVNEENVKLTAFEKNKVYGGCYVNAMIRLYGWEHEQSGLGVSASLEGVMFVRDGEPFGNRMSENEKLAGFAGLAAGTGPGASKDIPF